MSHTPGPWEWDESKNNKKRCLARESNGQLILAIDYELFNSFNNPADASLVEAAPDLLEALEWFIDFEDRAHHGLSSEDGPMMKAARDAVAKARGEE